MELSPPLRWLGALAIMIVVVLIVVPMLFDTVTDTIVFGGEASEPAAAAEGTPSEVASEAVATGDGGGNQGGGNQGGGGQGGGNQGGGGQNADGDFPATYTVVAGDTGTKISEQFYDSPDGWAQIAEANDIDPSAPLRVGLELTIPAPQ